jgi:hypothetical protein
MDLLNYLNHNKKDVLENSKMKLVTAAEAVIVRDGVTTVLTNIPHPAVVNICHV